MSDDENVAPTAGEGGRWFRFAEEDLRTAVACLDDGDLPPRQACYFSQQAVEKALKACLIACEVVYPRSHDLDYLRNLLPASWALHKTHGMLGDLTEWLVEARYPGDWPDATEQEARAAVDTAASVLSSLRADLRRMRGDQ